MTPDRSGVRQEADRRAEVLAEVEAARAAGFRPRVHGNGFVQLDLTPRRRLHVWGDSRVPRQMVPSYIHDHTFSFRSEIISGQIVHRVIAVVPDQAGAYDLYKAVTNHGEDTRLVLDGGRQMAVIVAEHLMREGMSYQFMAGQFHETVAMWPCVTVIDKSGPTLSQGGPSPRMLVPGGLEPDNQFDRYAVPADDLWPIIRAALQKAEGEP